MSKLKMFTAETQKTPRLQTDLAFFIPWRFALLLNLCIALLACQADANPTTNVTPSAAQQTPAVLTPIATPLAPNRTPPPTLAPNFTTPSIIELSIWMSDEFAPTTATAGGPAFATQVGSFHSTYNSIHVNVLPKKPAGKGGLTDLLFATYAVSLPQALPDVIALDLRELPLVVKTLNLQPLSSDLAPTLQSDLYAFALQAGQVDGQLYALAFTADVLHGAYTRTPITITVPVTITTFLTATTSLTTTPALTTTTSFTPTSALTTTTFITATPAFTTSTVLTTMVVTSTAPLTWNALLSSTAKYAFAAGGDNGFVNDSLLAQYVALGGRFTDARGKPALEREALRDVLEFYRSGVARGVFVPNVTNLKTHDDAWKVYQAGRATLVDVNARRYLLERTPQNDSDYVTLPTRNGNLVTLSHAWGYVIITKDPARRQAALRFVEWMLAADHNAGWNRTASRVPTRRSALLAWTSDTAYREFMQRLLAVAINRPPTVNPETLTAVLQNALNDVLLNSLSPTEAADKAVTTLAKP